MTRAFAALVVIPLAFAALGGCHDAPPATPAVTLPSVARPTAPVTAVAGSITVPQAALVERGGVPGVFVVEQGVARFRMVRAVPAPSGRHKILSGLHAGEVLVLGDLREVRDGSPLAQR